MTITKNETKKLNKELKILCCAVYFFSYLSRQNYPAVLTEIIEDMNVSKSLAGIALMGSFISYGIFQIISGIFGDKIKPQKLVFAGLFGSSAVNLLIWLFPNIYFMNVVWCLNGAFQSLIWPPLVRLIIENFGEKEYSVTVVRVTQASYIATVLVYLLSPFVIASLNWRCVFAFSGMGAMLFSLVWLIKTKNIESSLARKEKLIESEKEKINYRKLLASGFIPIILSTIVAGFMRDGISTWMPTYINETYGISSFSSILTGAVIPIFSALFLDVLNFIGEKIGNEMKTASLYLGVALLSCSLMYFGFSKLPVFDVALMVIVTICVHGVNLMLVCNVPKRFAKYGKSSTMSGILNASVYAGSAFSAYGVASLATEFGWRNVILFWIGAVAIVFVLCILWIKRFEKNMK
ncbi:MAG: MFS transporter [Ruminococcaceae bacterium]|nr:MFS transporter [Oscillospiraceae bacterium]